MQKDSKKIKKNKKINDFYRRKANDKSKKKQFDI